MKELTHLYIKEYLCELGLDPSMYGFRYIELVIGELIDAGQIFNVSSFRVYSLLRDNVNSTAKARRCMRYAIGTAWKRESKRSIHELFPNNEKCPTIIEFIPAAIKGALELRGRNDRRCAGKPTVTEELIAIGMNPALNGFYLIDHAVRLFLNDIDAYYEDKGRIFESLTKTYQVIKTTAYSNMEHAISSRWFSPISGKLRRLFPYQPANTPPPIHTFICTFGIAIMEKHYLPKK